MPPSFPPHRFSPAMPPFSPHRSSPPLPRRSPAALAPLRRLHHPPPFYGPPMSQVGGGARGPQCVLSQIPPTHVPTGGKTARPYPPRHHTRQPSSPRLPCPRPSQKMVLKAVPPAEALAVFFGRGCPQVRLSCPPLPLPPLNPIPNPPPKRVRTPQEGDGGGGRERPRVPLGPTRPLNHRPLRRGLVTPQA